MPTNRTRRTRAKSDLDSMKMEDLFYGPGTCLFNGEGYLGPHGDGFFRDKSPEVQAEILAAMRADWMAAYFVILRAWDDRDETELWCADRHHSNPSKPWALTEFGDPRNEA